MKIWNVKENSGLMCCHWIVPPIHVSTYTQEALCRGVSLMGANCRVICSFLRRDLEWFGTDNNQSL